jgi:NTP pyrophosphatase (non-canonical NTP hydrolase)
LNTIDGGGTEGNGLPMIKFPITDICAEIDRSSPHGEEFASLHEAYAVILEELDEVWEITRQKRRDRNADALRKELVQVAAMAIKAINSMDNFVGAKP